MGEVLLIAIARGLKNDYGRRVREHDSTRLMITHLSPDAPDRIDVVRASRPAAAVITSFFIITQRCIYVVLHYVYVLCM